MPIQPRIHTAKKNRRPSRTWRVVCVALICVLAMGLGILSVYTVLTVGENRRVLGEQAAAISALQQEVTQKQQELEQKQQELEQAQANASAAATEKDSKIAEQKKTVDELQKKIAELEKQLEAAEKAAASVPADGKPASSTQGVVNDYKGKKIVALTFDDGPGAYTGQLLDILKQRQVPATFFVLGTKVDANPALIKRMEAEGHEIGNHSNSHKNLQDMSTVAQVKAEMDLCANKVKKLVGHTPTVVRCPYGALDDTVKQYAKEAGVPLIQWDIDTRDWESRNAAKVISTTFASKGLGDGSIVLLHDIHKTTVEAVPALIDRFLAQGYTFVTVSDLLKARCGGVEAGKVYYEG